MVESKRRSLIFIIFIEEILKLLLFPDFERYKIVEFRIIRNSSLIIIGINTFLEFSNSRNFKRIYSPPRPVESSKLCTAERQMRGDLNRNCLRV